MKKQFLITVLMIVVTAIVCGYTWGPTHYNYMVDPIIQNPPSNPSKDEVAEIIINSDRIKNIVIELSNQSVWNKVVQKLSVGNFDYPTRPLSYYSEGSGYASGVTEGPVSIDDKLQNHLEMAHVEVEDAGDTVDVDFAIKDDLAGFYQGSCYNPCLNRRNVYEYPESTPTPNYPDDPNNPVPTPTPFDPDDPNTPEIPPTSDPTPPTYVYVYPTPNYPEIVHNPQPDQFTVVQTEYEHYDNSIFTMYYTRTWGEIEYDVEQQPTPVPSHCPTMIPTVPPVPTEIPEHCPTLGPNPTNPTPVEEPTTPPHHVDQPEHNNIPDY